MKNDFSKAWNSSKKPNKQRKFRFNAPHNIRGKFLNVHLSKELRQKHGFRALRVKVGDKVRIMRGQFKKQEGKVEEVNSKNIKLFIAKIEHTKRDGTKARYPIDPSNVMLVELNTDDKRRLSKPEAKAKVVKSEKNDKVQEKPAKSVKPAVKSKVKNGSAEHKG